MGRFIQPDTIVPGVGSQVLNRYMYVLGNPIKHNDPFGHCVPLILDGEMVCFDEDYNYYGLKIGTFIVNQNTVFNNFYSARGGGFVVKSIQHKDTIGFTIASVLHRQNNPYRQREIVTDSDYFLFTRVYQDNTNEMIAQLIDDVAFLKTLQNREVALEAEVAGGDGLRANTDEGIDINDDENIITTNEDNINDPYKDFGEKDIYLWDWLSQYLLTYNRTPIIDYTHKYDRLEKNLDLGS